jgi:protein-tyrosine-phosphatase
MKVLFVCHGNIERSASAEIIARRLYPHWEVKSCGVAAKNGRITGKKMRTALAEREYATQGIRSTMITQEQVDWADRIFYMDGGNERRFIAQFGTVAKAQRLSDYVEGAKTVPNPGRCKDLTMHLRIVDMIVEALPKIEQENTVDSIAA